jgi:hypothetical protein
MGNILTENVMFLNLAKYGFGYILGVFFTKASDYPTTGSPECLPKCIL